MDQKLYRFLFGITVFRLLYAIILPIAPQEAYYWNYSRHPALSYFDHPPIAAYFIRLTTSFGSSGFAIHLAAIIISVLMALALYQLTKMLFDEIVAFWTVVVLNLTFIYALGAMIITPDAPMLLFWVLTMTACVKIDRDEGNIWWILLGIFLGAGFDSKYPMVFAGLGTIIFLLSSKERRQHFRTLWPYVALAVSIVVVLPVLYWNYSTHWASFLFQTERRASELIRFRADYFFGFVGTVLAIYGFLPLPLLFAGIIEAIKKSFIEKSSAYILIISFSLPLVLFLFPLATKSWVKMNWTAPAFIGWFIAAVAYYFNYRDEKKWVRVWGNICLVFIALALIAVHIIAVAPNIYVGRGDYFSGWKELAAKVEVIRAEMPGPYFICGYEYKTASMMAFYLKDNPETVSNNIIGEPGLEYDYWCNPDTLRGYNAVFIYDDRAKPDRDKLSKYFGKIGQIDDLLIIKSGKTLTRFHVIKCYDYLALK